MEEKQIQTRARSPKDKEIRRVLILESSLQLFQKMELAQISMDLIAKKSNLAKGTLYLYFKTKEEVFLALLSQKLDDWITAIKMEFGNIQHPLPAQEFAQIFSSSLSFAPELPRLLTLPPKAHQYKLTLKSQLLEVAGAISHKSPALTSQTTLPFLMKFYSVLIGLYSISNPNALMENVLQNPELEIFQVSFQEQLTETLCMILVGMEEIESKKSKSFHLFENY